MDKGDVVRLAEILMDLKGIYQEIFSLEKKEDSAYNKMSHENQYSVKGEIMLENVDYIDDALEELDTCIDKLHSVLRNCK